MDNTSMDRLAREAYETYAATLGSAKRWHELHRDEQLAWCRALERVLSDRSGRTLIHRPLA